MGNWKYGFRFLKYPWSTYPLLSWSRIILIFLRKWSTRQSHCKILNNHQIRICQKNCQKLRFVQPASIQNLYFWVTQKPVILPKPSLFGSTKTISRPITSKLNEGCLLGKVDAAAVVFSSTNPPVSIYLKDDGAMAKKNPYLSVLFLVPYNFQKYIRQGHIISIYV